MIKQWIPRFSLAAFVILFLSGCYTQVGTVKKTTRRDYEPPRDEIVYEDEYNQYQNEVDTVYVEPEEKLPTYQYNFYNYDPYDYDFYFSPYSRSFSVGWGYDPWLYDPWFYDPYYVSWNRPYWQPYRSWSFYAGYSPGFWGGYYGYGGGYFGYSSGYYGTYDPYWGYYSRGYYGGYANVKPQNRRDFDYRRGLAERSGTEYPTPHMVTVASGSKNTSRIERIRKTSTTIDDKAQALHTSSSTRTRKNSEGSIQAITKKPVRKLSSQERITRTPAKVRTNTSTRVPSNRSAISNTTSRTTKANPGVSSRQRTSKSIPNVSSRGSSNRTKSKSSSTNVRRSKTSTTYMPSSTRSSSSSSGNSGATYRPRTSRSGSSTSSRTSSSGSKSGSSSRTKKK